MAAHPVCVSQSRKRMQLLYNGSLLICRVLARVVFSKSTRPQSIRIPVCIYIFICIRDDRCCMSPAHDRSKEAFRLLNTIPLANVYACALAHEV